MTEATPSVKRIEAFQFRIASDMTPHELMGTYQCRRLLIFLESKI